MKLTEKMKKNLAILGGVLIGIGLIAAIGMQFGPKPSGEDVLPGTGETETELIVDPGDFEKISGKGYFFYDRRMGGKISGGCKADPVGGA